MHDIGYTDSSYYVKVGMNESLPKRTSQHDAVAHVGLCRLRGWQGLCEVDPNQPSILLR